MKHLLKDIQLDCIKNAEKITQIAKSYEVKNGLNKKELENLEFLLSIGLQLYLINLDITSYKSGIKDSIKELFKKVKSDIELTAQIHLN